MWRKTGEEKRMSLASVACCLHCIQICCVIWRTRWICFVFSFSRICEGNSWHLYYVENNVLLFPPLLKLRWEDKQGFLRLRILIFLFVAKLVELQHASSGLSRLLWHNWLRMKGMAVAPLFTGFILSYRKVLVDPPPSSSRSVPRTSLV